MADDDEYEIPLQDQRVFGAGLKRKRVQFVPSSSATPSANTTRPTSGQSVSDRYLSLVLPAAGSSPSNTSTATDADGTIHLQSTTILLCEICQLPLDGPTAPNGTATTAADHPSRHHEASLAHQVCLPHSHPPSHIDRRRKGLGILSAYGWDPDARRGLGSAEQGIQFPIKAKVKDDKLGLGVVVPKGLEKEYKKKKVEKLDAGKVRRLEEQDRRKRERLQEMFYRSEDLDRYLGKA